MRRICYICNKSIRWNDVWVMYSYDIDSSDFSNGKKIFSHKHTCSRKEWKLTSYFRKQKRRVKVVDRKFINRRKQHTKNNKRIRRSRLCGCGTCVHS